MITDEPFPADLIPSEEQIRTWCRYARPDADLAFDRWLALIDASIYGPDDPDERANQQVVLGALWMLLGWPGLPTPLTSELIDDGLQIKLPFMRSPYRIRVTRIPGTEAEQIDQGR